MTHSPEPWEWNGPIDKYSFFLGEFLDANGNTICSFGSDDEDCSLEIETPSPEDIQRILACVNACAGIPTQHLIDCSVTSNFQTGC